MSWEVYLQESISATEEKLDTLTAKRAEFFNDVDYLLKRANEDQVGDGENNDGRQKSRARSVAGQMEQNKLVFKAFADDGRDTRAFFESDQLAENYMLQDELLWTITVDSSICPLIDCCCDKLGSNSLAPFYYSAREDCRKQNLSGLSFMVNPPYKDIPSFVSMCEKACEQDPATQPILILPDNSSDVIKQWKAGNRWQVISYIEKGAQGVFSQPRDGLPYHLARHNLKASLDFIMCCVYRRQESGGTTVAEEIATIRQAQTAMRSFSAASMRQQEQHKPSLSCKEQPSDLTTTYQDSYRTPQPVEQPAAGLDSQAVNKSTVWPVMPCGQ